eukprot:44121-Pyramimonas_sp.AAC.1
MGTKVPGQFGPKERGEAHARSCSYPGPSRLPINQQGFLAKNHHTSRSAVIALKAHDLNSAWRRQGYPTLCYSKRPNIPTARTK